MLKQYLRGKNKTAFAKQIGITRQHLDNIIKKKEPNLSVLTAMKIREITNIEPWSYLDLETLKSLKK